MSNQNNEAGLKHLYDVTESDAKEIIKAGYPSFFHNNNWKIKDDSDVLKERCMCLYSDTKAYDFTFYEDTISITSTTDEEIFTNIWDDTNFSIHMDCYIKAAELGYFVPKLSAFAKHQVDQAIRERDETKKYSIDCNGKYLIGIKVCGGEVKISYAIDGRGYPVAPKINEVNGQ